MMLKPAAVEPVDPKPHKSRQGADRAEQKPRHRPMRDYCGRSNPELKKRLFMNNLLVPKK